MFSNAGHPELADLRFHLDGWSLPRRACSCSGSGRRRHWSAGVVGDQSALAMQLPMFAVFAVVAVPAWRYLPAADRQRKQPVPQPAHRSPDRPRVHLETDHRRIGHCGSTTPSGASPALMVHAGSRQNRADGASLMVAAA
jgi:hypothetical protein